MTTDQLIQLLPHGLILAGALLTLIVGAILGGGFAVRLTGIASFAVAIAGSLQTPTNHGGLWGGIYQWDTFAQAITLLVLVVGLLTCLASFGGEPSDETGGSAAYYSLLLFSAFGFAMLVCSGSLLMLFLSLEVGTVSLFALAGMRKTSPLSAEAALKFLIVSVSSSAVLLYGISLIYGAFGTTFYGAGLELPIDRTSSALALVGVALIVGGLAFKITAAPFHLWAPDVYQGAPTTFVAFLSTASKAAGLAAIMRFLMAAVPAIEPQWALAMMILAATSMLVGNLAALRQSSLKRMLAYSGVAQAGYLLIAVAAGLESGLGSTVFYLIVYSFANAGAFFVVHAVQQQSERESLDSLRGLRVRAPFLAFAMLVFLLSLGGIPPMVGFWGKMFLFWSGAAKGMYWLVLIGAVTSVIALYYYLMVAKRIFIDLPTAETPQVSVKPSLMLSVALCVVAVLALGFYPIPLVDRSNQSQLTIKRESGAQTAGMDRGAVTAPTSAPEQN